MIKIIKNIALPAALLAMTSAGASDFTGSYVGVKVGSNRADTSDGLVTSRENATTYGLEGGHGWDMGKTMLGVDGFYDTNREKDHTPAAHYGSTVYGLGLKLGLPLNSLMPYAKLGYAHTSGTGSISNFGDNRLNGGLGLEYKFAPNWSMAGEWTTISPNSNGVKLNNDNFTIGVNYYFTPPKAAPAPVAPVVIKEEPAPVPPPVVKEAPAPQPRESWKTILEEKPVRIEGANFDTDSAKLKPTADAKLQQVVEFARRYPDANLEVSGYTDSRGDKTHNLKLSQRRAESVKAYLVKNGVAAEHISTKGYGVDNPVADNKTKEGRAANRRVEIRYTIREERKVRVTE